MSFQQTHTAAPANTTPTSNTMAPATTSPVPSAAAAFPLSVTVIWILCFVCTPFCGSVLYYAWRKKHPEAAQLANRVSWASWLFWFAAGMLYGALTRG